MAMLIYPLKKWQVYFHDHFGAIEIDDTLPKIFKLINKNYNYIGVSKSLTDWASKKLGLKTNQIYLLPNIRDIKPVTIHQEKDKSIKEQSINLVHVSNIHPIKHIEFSIQILYELRKKREAKLTVYGQITDKHYFQSLVLLSEKLNLKEDLVFIHDQLNIPSILHKYDLGLCTSKSESGPLVLIEYLSRELPFVSYNTGEVLRQIGNQYPLFIIDSFEKKIWVERILDIFDNSSNHKKSLINIFNQYFSDKSYFNSLMAIYQ